MSSTKCTKPDIAHRMRQLRKALAEKEPGLRYSREGLPQEVMAEALDGISRSVLANVESGRAWPSRNLLEALASTYNVSSPWLLFGEGAMFRLDVEVWEEWERKNINFMDPLKPHENQSEPPVPQEVEDHVSEVWLRFEAARSESKRSSKTDDEAGLEEFALIPFFDIPVSAGAGKAALSQAPKFHIGYRRDYLNKRGLVASNLLELPIAGDSMSPELESGDTVLVDKSRTNVAGDGIYVIAVDDLLYCKRLQLLPGRVLRVISINAEGYKPYEVKVSEDGETPAVEIIGRVVRQGRDR